MSKATSDAVKASAQGSAGGGAEPASSVAYVCVPARNEAELLPTLFAALARQSGDVGEWSLCLLLDGCSDASREVAEQLARSAPFPVALRSRRSETANAGRARAAAVMMAQQRAAGASALFLTTDADSAPAADWIAASRRALADCDVATGRLLRAPGSPVQDRVEAYYDRLYALRRRLDPVAWEPGPHHHFTGGANMAFRSEAYLRLGGFAPRPSGEDALIIDEAQRAGLRVRRDPAMVVHTSSRCDGRAPAGLASCLQAAARGAEQVRVAHPDAMAWQYASHALARAAFNTLDADGAAVLERRLSLGPAHVAAVARECPNAESFATRVVPAPHDRRTVSLPEAEAALASLEGRRREQAA